MENIKVSVIVPIYNAEKCMNRCIESIINQSLKEIEILLLDDVSTDRSLEMIKEYEIKFPEKIRAFAMKKNSRGSQAINRGIQEAKGEYIGFADNDDWIEKTMFEKMYEKAKDCDADVVDCDVKLVDPKGNVLGIEISNTDDQTGIIDSSKRKALFLSPGWRLSKLYRREILVEQNICYPDGISYGDNYFTQILVGEINSLYKVREPLYCYVSNGESSTRTYNNPLAFDRLEAAIRMLEELTQRGKMNEFGEEILFRFFELYYIYSIQVFLTKFKPVNKKYLYKIRQYMKENYPSYRKNKYFKSRILWGNRVMSKLNDFSPNMLCIIYHILNLPLLKDQIKKKI